MDLDDWVILGLVMAIQIVATVFLFEVPRTEVYIAWGTITTGTYGAFHWLRVKDSKTPDA